MLLGLLDLQGGSVQACCKKVFQILSRQPTLSWLHFSYADVRGHEGLLPRQEGRQMLL